VFHLIWKTVELSLLSKSIRSWANVFHFTSFKRNTRIKIGLHKALHCARGIQYVHCVMHKCIMVKVRGKQKTHQACKKTRKFYEIRGKFAKVGGTKKKGKMNRNSENRREIQNLGWMTKKSCQKFCRMKIENFFEKVKLWKFSTKSEIFF